MDRPTSPSTRLSPTDARALIGYMGLGDASILSRPSHCVCPYSHRASCAALAAASVEASWANDTLEGLADTSVTLPDSTELVIGSITFAADGPAFTRPPEAGDPTEFAALADDYAEVLAGPPQGLPPDRGPAFELHIDTGSHPMPRSRQMKRWSQGKLDECRK